MAMMVSEVQQQKQEEMMTTSRRMDWIRIKTVVVTRCEMLQLVNLRIDHWKRRRYSR